MKHIYFLLFIIEAQLYYFQHFQGYTNLLLLNKLMSCCIKKKKLMNACCWYSNDRILYNMNYYYAHAMFICRVTRISNTKNLNQNRNKTVTVLSEWTRALEYALFGKKEIVQNFIETKQYCFQGNGNGNFKLKLNCGKFF